MTILYWVKFNKLIWIVILSDSLCLLIIHPVFFPRGYFEPLFIFRRLISVLSFLQFPISFRFIILLALGPSFQSLFIPFPYQSVLMSLKVLTIFWGYGLSPSVYVVFVLTSFLFLFLRGSLGRSLWLLMVYVFLL